jgi:hypothetical protein
MIPGMDRRDQEEKTIRIMIGMFCAGRHGHKRGLCAECSGLLEYALDRSAKCRFGANKPVCRNCAVHCYKPKMREKIRQVMRYAGPRLLFHNPFLSLMHIFDSIRFKKGRL